MKMEPFVLKPGLKVYIGVGVGAKGLHNSHQLMSIHTATMVGSFNT